MFAFSRVKVRPGARIPLGLIFSPSSNCRRLCLHSESSEVTPRRQRFDESRVAVHAINSSCLCRSAFVRSIPVFSCLTTHPEKESHLCHAWSETRHNVFFSTHPSPYPFADINIRDTSVYTAVNDDQDCSDANLPDVRPEIPAIQLSSSVVPDPWWMQTGMIGQDHI